jgi:glycosyltransferase involved in cell wall biosynthesis
VFGLIAEIRRNVRGKRISGLLRLVGKGDRKVAAVFGHTQEVCRRAVAHVRAGAPGVPVVLFTTVTPPPETAAQCEAVHVDRRALRLMLRAHRVLWPRRVALGVAGWTGKGPLPVKLAPLTIFPFRSLFLNAGNDFFPGTPRAILRHNRRAVRDRLHSGGHRARDLAGGAWRMATHHVWRSGPCVRVKDVGAGYGRLMSLWFLRAGAGILRVLGYPHRRWFARLHGSQPLDLPLPRPHGSSVIHITQSGVSWNATEFAELVRSSDARWILWTRDGAADDIADMLPLFDDDRTFAVSRQADYRGWKQQLFACAPFRALQPGEATRVLAPLSPAILVDRQKLAALGLPRCGLPGAAWMALFWKAAAAGWRSYSVGQPHPLRAQPDSPLDEASFFFHALATPSLHRLAPIEPELSAGNIAFPIAPARSHRPSDRLKVLIVSPFLPFPLSHGGAVRIYNLCRSLSGRVDFALAAIREKDETVDYARLREVFREVRVVDLDEKASTDAFLPAQVRHHNSRSLRALIAEMAREWQPDVLQIEYTHMAAFSDAAPGVPSILVEHDITFSLYRQLAESNPSPDAWREFERWKSFETRWLRAFDGVWTVSGEDRFAAIQESGRDDASTFTVPNGVDTHRFQPREDAAEDPEILYVGSFRHLPNLIGFEALRTEVMPRVWSRHPNARLRVVAGPRHEEFWARFAAAARSRTIDPRITMHGFVEDLRPLYGRASAVAVPLAVSAGTNIKVLEAMACGKAIVSTPPGCAGLGVKDGRELLVRGDWGAFAAALGEVLFDAGLRAHLGLRARRAAEARFSWRAIAEQALESYLAVRAGSRAGELVSGD